METEKLLFDYMNRGGIFPVWNYKTQRFICDVCKKRILGFTYLCSINGVKGKHSCQECKDKLDQLKGEICANTKQSTS